MDFNSYLLMGVLGLLVLSLLGRGSASDSTRLGAIERKLNLILSNLGIDPCEGLDAQLLDLMKTGQKIQAIKLFRQQTGVGLKEAKEYVERL